MTRALRIRMNHKADMVSSDTLTYCGEQARQYDRDRFVASMLMPPPVRPSLWALYAFNHEIARTREVVTDTTLGLIRLQWWRDALAAFYDYGRLSDNPIMQALGAAIKRHDLPRDAFESLLYAREFDLEDMMPANLEGLENYAEYTNAPLIRLGLRIVGDDPDQSAAVPIAKAYAMAGLLRSLPFHASQRRCYMPADLMHLNDVNEGLLYEDKPQDALRSVVGKVVTRAETLLDGCFCKGRYLNVTGHQAHLFLRRIRHFNCDVYHPGVALPPLFYPLRLMRAARKKHR